MQKLFNNFFVVYLRNRKKTKINPLSLLTAIIIGARLGGIGLGVMGGVGLGILTFVFGLQPTAPPIDVMLMIAAVISAASCMQAAGGLDYMVKLAEHLLRKNPSHVTLLSPLVTYLFTFSQSHLCCNGSFARVTGRFRHYIIRYS